MVDEQVKLELINSATQVVTAVSAATTNKHESIVEPLKPVYEAACALLLQEFRGATVQTKRASLAEQIKAGRERAATEPTSRNEGG